MNLFNLLRLQIIEAITVVAQSNNWELDTVPLNSITVELPRNVEHGDVATNAAMILAKPVKSNPRAIAELLKSAFETIAHCESVEIAGPGFINLRFAPALWQSLLPAIIDKADGFGASLVGAGKKVNVEYVSANPTGPMHIGHARGAVVGDALASLLQKAGYDVTREYYVNDAGSQVDTLARSVHLRFREALGEEIGDIPEGYYPGDYLIEVGKLAVQKFPAELKDADEAIWLEDFKRFAVEQMLELIKQDLALLGISHDIFVSEHTLTQKGKVEEALAFLQSEGLIYEGILEPPKGKVVEQWESRPQTLFKSTDFGDDVDRALKKADGSYTYFAPDIAYHYDKVQRGYDVLIDILGADHGGYVKRISAAVKAMSAGKVPLHVRLCNLVKFMRDGEPVKMSKRSGSFITVREVVEQVGKDSLRFIMLTRKNDAPLDFDMDKAIEKSRDNPVFYVQYAHARCHSILRMSEEKYTDIASQTSDSVNELIALLNSTAELAMMKKLAAFPVMIEQAALTSEPHRVAFYLQELAAEFHSLWNAGNDAAELRFITEDQKITAARRILIDSVAQTLQNGLDILGVDAPKEMR